MSHSIPGEERTTPIRLFNYAQSYFVAASYLEKAELESTHPDAVVRFLYYHSMELYLKAFLMIQEHSIDKLRRKFGHNISKLATAAARQGLGIDDKLHQVIALSEFSDDVMTSRYIRTGFYTLPKIETLHQTCEELRNAIATAFKERGLPVRF